MRYLPSAFFISYLLIFILVVANFSNSFLSIAKSSNLYVNKFKIKYLSRYLSEQSLMPKLFILVNQLFLLSTVIALTSLIKQRINVPELISQHSKNYTILISCFISVICTLAMTFFYEESFSIFYKALGLCDNPIFLTFMVSTIIYCYLSLDILDKFNLPVVQKNVRYLYLKSSLLVLMTVQISICIGFLL